MTDEKLIQILRHGWRGGFVDEEMVLAAAIRAKGEALRENARRLINELENGETT
jgi:hypothetical protein